MVLEINKFFQKIKLGFIKGLHKPKYLSNKEINQIRILNNPNNTGVEEVLNKKYVLLVFHDSNFREPREKIVKKIGNETIFPPIPFKEIKNSISASPSKKLHEYLIKKTKIKKDWASLLIGFQ